MKKMAAFLLVFLFMFITAASAFATNEIQVVIDGKTQSFNVAPQNLDGRILVPLRAVFEGMGASIEWDGDTKTVTATKGNTIVVLGIGDTSPTVNGKVVFIDQPGIIVQGRTLAPLRFVAEAFGGTAEWDIPNNTAIITRNPTGSTILYINRQLGFSIEFPASWWGKYSIEISAFERNGGTAGAASIYHNPTIDELGYAGFLFALGRAPGEDYTEDDPPIYAGGSKLLAIEDGYTYFINFPSGVEYSEAVNSESAVEYKEWESQITYILDSFKLVELDPASFFRTK